MDIYSILVASAVGSAAVLGIAVPALLAMTIIDITRALRAKPHDTGSGRQRHT